VTAFEAGAILEGGWVVLGVADPNGDDGGDVQDSEAYVTTFTKPIGDGLHARIGVSCYVAAYEPGQTRSLHNDWITDRRVMQHQIEYLICWDPNEPGGTEVWSDAHYIDHQLNDPDGAGDAAALHAARNVDPPEDDEWNAAVDKPYWIMA